MQKLLVFILLACSAMADVVELKTGDRLEGAFRQATPAGVVIEVGGQSITMWTAKAAKKPDGKVRKPKPEE